MDDVNSAMSQSAGVSGKGFINHVFNFNTETKTELMNLGQYLALVLLPLTFLNNFVDFITPFPRSEKLS